MAERAIEILDGAIIKRFIVAANKTVTANFPVKFSGADNAVEAMAAIGDDVIGIALDGGAAGAEVRVALFGKGVAKVKVGTGGATRGSPAKYTSDGLTNATVGGGTTKLVVCGQFLQSGSAGDLVGLNLGAFSFTVGS